MPKYKFTGLSKHEIRGGAFQPPVTLEEYKNKVMHEDSIAPLILYFIHCHSGLANYLLVGTMQVNLLYVILLYPVDDVIRHS